MSFVGARALVFLGVLAALGCGSGAGSPSDGGADHAAGGDGGAGSAAGAGGSGAAGAGGSGGAGAGGGAGASGSGGAGASGDASAGASGDAGASHDGGAGNGAGGSSDGGASAGMGGGAGHSGDLCELTSDCAAGVCWQQLQGNKICVAPVTAPMLSSCQPAGQACCSADADCKDKAHGRCLPRTSFPGCGGAIPQGNGCVYDDCATDADCAAAMPAGRTVATCLPSGAFGTFTATCATGVCRTNADCLKHPGGVCQYGLAPPHGQCVITDVLFCAYPSDPCPTTACAFPMSCLPNDDLQGRQCSQGLPMYP